jgi:hypothetical protein
MRSRRPNTESGIRIPDHLTPFALLDLLGKEDEANGFVPERRAQLRETMASIEQHYFANGNNAASLDLRRIAEEWVR